MKRGAFKRGLAVGASLIGFSAAAMAVPTTASAAGELQVTVHTNYADDIQVSGINQYGNYVETGWIATPNAWTRVPNWWWRGSVTVHGVGRHNGRTLESYVSCRIVPGGTPNYADCYAL
ncbi:hypothetical protein [Streptomyces sp. TP-A0356]|uniref:hypothetical protein n=1 Tax=Streptomyces sp. TP-A0356 TaxID=1359208 RepID=UPI0006E35CAE|nr:hypothetical protein [Streptomyces sp. TP-A0356]